MGHLTRKTPLKRTRIRRSAKRQSSRKAWRDRALSRAGYLCERCGLDGLKHGGRYLDAHHILPRGRGGTDEDWNAAILCGGCHMATHEYRIPDARDFLASTEAEAMAIRERLDGKANA